MGIGKEKEGTSSLEISSAIKEFLKERQEDEEGTRRNSYEGSWGEIARKTLYILRNRIPKTRPYEIQQGGWIEIEKLQEYGIQIDEQKAGGLSKGMGAGDKIRFAVGE